MRRRQTAEERFWAKVDRREPDECWRWVAAVCEGYGRFYVDGKHMLAHRYSYALLIGSIPEGLTIDHLCRNRACVNPAHMEPVVGAVNTRRGIGGQVAGERQRGKTHCPSGHPYDEANTYVTKNGERNCRVCRKEAKRRHREKKAAERGNAVGVYVGERTHCPRGHLYDEANTYRWRGARMCRTCLRERKRRQYHAKKAKV